MDSDENILNGSVPGEHPYGLRGIHDDHLPEVWNNPCNSRGQTSPPEADAELKVLSKSFTLTHLPTLLPTTVLYVTGIRHAAARKLQHELGIPLSDIPLEGFRFLTRLHYCAPDTVKSVGTFCVLTL